MTDIWHVYNSRAFAVFVTPPDSSKALLLNHVTRPYFYLLFKTLITSLNYGCKRFVGDGHAISLRGSL